ncbi:MAG: GGDEF domain-containing response regulator [Chromatiales bacterium]|jgi:diguanylate cyclase (GGDEF)-like protein|nr:GGDEF domain-containing response regulator [Chromatiales bacterium]MDP7094216.1 EAL domain-containing protein [Gammaproteobacteria bacterium]HJP03588.1 EAL domain-containing protein [Gammaproteobacteria bacterium]
MKLLLVEDNLTDAEFLQASLRRSKAEDVDLTHVTTIKEGTRAVRKGGFDVILLDLNLPDGSGIECVEAMQEADPDMPIVVLSGQDDEDFAISILSIGVQDYLVKWEGKGRLILRSIRFAIERKRSEKRLNYLAQYDSLTGVPNRQYLTEQLDQSIARAQRAGNKVALFYLDLDKFKAVNDTLGHDAGDLLLKEVAQRLYLHTRAGDVLARLGGDEFAVVIEGLNQAHDAESFARNIVNSLVEPFMMNGREVQVTASIGISIFPDDSNEAAVLLKNADIAMYQAKEGGRNEFKFFTEHMHAELVERHQLEQDIQTALRLKQFALVYQPKVSIETLQLTGMEALIRWNCPTRGLVRPAHFIHAAEESGYIVPLGYWILSDICRTLKTWQEDGLKVTPVSVNVSARQFQQADFPDRVANILEQHEIDSSLIELELTEGLLMEDTDAAQICLEKLKKIGLSIAIDDFGTGNSCLAYLRKFPIDILKIDKSFVDEVGESADSDQICKAIISLAKSLGLETVAEGVETERQLEFLKENGCDIAQGYLFGHPIWGKEIIELLDHSKGNFASLKPTISFKNSETQNARILNLGAKYLT